MITIHHGESVSTWMGSVPPPTFNTLNENYETEVCIIGGGIMGLTIAYQILQTGRKVCVLEGFEIGCGQTGRSTAQFTTALDTPYHKLEKYHGRKGAKLAAESHSSAIEHILEIIRKEKIECDLEKINGYLFCSPEKSHNIDVDEYEKNINFLNLELAALERSGIQNIHITQKIKIGHLDAGPALCFPDQYQLNPLKLLNGLASAIVKKGGVIFTNSHVVEVYGGENATVRLQNGRVVKCESIVVATNSPINDLVALHTKLASYRTYVIGLGIPKDSIIKGLYWDNEDPYHYLRLEKTSDSTKEILMIGGEDHKTGQNDNPEQCYTRLENWARIRFPDASRVFYKWSGHVMEPVDGLAYIGRNPMDSNNVYVVTGHSGNGMTYSMIAGLIITDLIAGRKNPWENLYSPSRITLSTAANYIKENANTLAQYKDWFTEKNIINLDDIQEEEGAVIRDGMHFIAAYKDQFGNLELNSAVCPHLGGIVHWNKAEKSWDCPCHGSRFDCHGKVIDGPSVNDLTMISSTPALHPPTPIKAWPNPDTHLV